MAEWDLDEAMQAIATKHALTTQELLEEWETFAVAWEREHGDQPQPSQDMVSLFSAQLRPTGSTESGAERRQRLVAQSKLVFNAQVPSAAEFGQDRVLGCIDIQEFGSTQASVSMALDPESETQELLLARSRVLVDRIREDIASTRGSPVHISEPGETSEEFFFLGAVVLHNEPQQASQTHIGKDLSLVAHYDARLDLDALFVLTLGGKLIRLNIESVSHVSLFQGCAFVAFGRMQTPGIFDVTEIFTGVSPGFPSELAFSPTKGESLSPLSIIVASGPFCLFAQKDYWVLEDFLQIVLERIPDVLNGPFIIEGENPLEFHESFQDQFEYILGLIFEVLPEQTRAVFIPSSQDIHHDVVFPQRKFSDSGIAAGILPRITFLPNPGKVVIQKSKDFQPLLLSLCSEDVLMEMSRLEASKHDSPQDRIQNLFAHLLKQQSFYPLYPQPFESEVNLELSRYQDYALDVKPHIMIVPSMLAQCVKDAEGVVCINPGVLVRKNHPGTFCEIAIHRQSEDCIEESITSRTRVEIFKLSSSQ